MARHELVDKALAMLKPAVPPPEPGSHEWWVDQWGTLSRETHGLTPDDPRLNPILDALAVCDRHYRTADLDGFTKASERVRRLMRLAPNARVWWEGAVNHLLRTLGPATVEDVQHDTGRLWVWVTWQGTGRWVSESLITNIEGPTT